MYSQITKKEALRQKKFNSIWNDDVKLLFNDIADSYDDVNVFFSFGLWHKIRGNYINSIYLHDDAKVLDVCAGTNAVGIDLLTKNPTIDVTAVDRSPEMQKIGAANAAVKGFSIKSVISDAHELPFERDNFDTVTLEFATRHLEVNKAFSEIYRVLKPGGHFYHFDLVKPVNPLVTFIYYNYLRFMIPVTSFTFLRKKKFDRSRKRFFKLGSYFIDAIHNFYTADELSVILKELGFKEVKSKTLAGGTFAIHQAGK